ncbi:phenylacetate--CoA ligase family protein [uncultured Bacteroides sp.]|uniref:phenylacetate--CoA ligase family protein n=1 Tax=uncultured Bacteroides sp. TaxID=162156 RepID=UPI002675205C|nr:phenylacetate--CoA ligase family protein [uncultured Bacteroides sp.]
MNSFSIYKKLPISVQNILCSIQGYKLNKLRYGTEYLQIAKDLEKSDQWNAEQILQYKEEQLSYILRYAYEHCKYYRQKFNKAGVLPDDFNHLPDLQKFPVLTKEEVRAHWKEMLSDEFSEKDLVIYHTSGSTGTPLNFYWTKENIRHYWATVWRARGRVKIKKGDLHLNFTGKLVVPLEQQNPPYWRYNRFLNQYMINQQHITDEKITDLVEFINKKQFKFFVGYPSIITSFAMLAEKHGLQIINSPQYIFPSAEKLYEHQRIVIERVFKGVCILEHYGFSEEAAAASKCECGYYHEDFEMGHLELVNEQDIESGKSGIMLATGFKNLAMPFIRYKIGDRATYTEIPCSCGRQSQRILDIEGRTEDYIVTPEGAHIMRLGYLLKSASHIAEAQIVQSVKGEIIIKIVQLPGYTNEDENSIRQVVREQFSPTMKVGFEYVDSIPRTKAGKFKYVVSLLSNQ